MVFGQGFDSPRLHQNPNMLRRNVLGFPLTPATVSRLSSRVSFFHPVQLLSASRSPKLQMKLQTPLTSSLTPHHPFDILLLTSFFLYRISEATPPEGAERHLASPLSQRQGRGLTPPALFYLLTISRILLPASTSNGFFSGFHRLSWSCHSSARSSLVNPPILRSPSSASA